MASATQKLAWLRNIARMGDGGLEVLARRARLPVEKLGQNGAPCYFLWISIHYVTGLFHVNQKVGLLPGLQAGCAYFLSRSSRRKILPTGDLGRSARNSTTLGCL
jgi:hypothetical protein